MFNSATLLALLPWAGGLAQPEQILNQLQQRNQVVKSLHVRASWDDLSDGQLKSWEVQTIYRDNLGRMRIIRENGFYDDKGNRQREPKNPHVVDTLYDGEKTLDLSIYPQWNREGKPLSGSKEKGGYRAAIVYDGKHPPGGLETYRNPITYLSDFLMFGLIESRETGREVKVEQVGETQTYQVTYERSPGRDIGGVSRNVALLDAAKGWVPLRIDSIGKDDRVIRRMTCEYIQDQQANWVPTKGGMQHFETRDVTQTPLWESRFQVQDAQINAPDFDDGVFKIVLEPDTVIWDGRYKVSYRVGDQKVYGDRLAALADEARAKQAQPRSNPATVTPTRPTRSRVRAIIVLTLILAGLLTCYGIYRVVRARRSTL